MSHFPSDLPPLPPRDDFDENSTPSERLGWYRTRVAELETSVIRMHQDCSRLTVERDRYRAVLERVATTVWDEENNPRVYVREALSPEWSCPGARP